ncbi:TadE/TadG family type IV pilus assembly protein [Sporosarcina sp. FSL K6-3457]|uniref:TadE/TadG family type IV pilus assembly protein n=1 Tax=Sporosarcina sp. FSL K6-3457 TaxID=2978204 RepID=UPI0030FB3E67
MKFRKVFRNERGVATIEFLAMLPLVFFIMMVFFQFLVAGYAIIIAQSAANEAAKTYAVTSSIREAESAAEKVVDTAGDNLEFKKIEMDGGSDFELTVFVDMNLIFVPEKWTGKLPEITFSKSISGRVMN